jgi:zinc transport system ATP-binding protein
MHTVDHTINVVEVRHVSFGYGTTEVLTDLNLDIHRGDYLGIVGSNGSGKTTLLKLMVGLLVPSSGSIKLFGTEISAFTNWPVIGYVPQKATSFDTNFPVTVEEVALMGRFGRRGLFHRITEEDRQQAREALDRVEMGHVRHRLIGDLSGGQQQRVFIARALATEPEIIFLDEPTVGVEKQIRDEFYALLKQLNRDLHLTVVLITHDLESVAYEAMHVAHIDRGCYYFDSAETFLRQRRPAEHAHR